MNSKIPYLPKVIVFPDKQLLQFTFDSSLACPWGNNRNTLYSTNFWIKKKFNGFLSRNIFKLSSVVDVNWDNSFPICNNLVFKGCCFELRYQSNVTQSLNSKKLLGSFQGLNAVGSSSVKFTNVMIFYL